MCMDCSSHIIESWALAQSYCSISRGRGTRLTYNTVNFPLQVGRLLDRDSKSCKATVEVVYNSKVLTVDYDNLCEYTGDIEDL